MHNRGQLPKDAGKLYKQINDSHTNQYIFKTIMVINNNQPDCLCCKLSLVFTLFVHIASFACMSSNLSQNILISCYKLRSSTLNNIEIPSCSMIALLFAQIHSNLHRSPLTFFLTPTQEC